METVVLTPFTVRAEEDGGLVSDAFHVIQPDLRGGEEGGEGEGRGGGGEGEGEEEGERRGGGGEGEGEGKI